MTKSDIDFYLAFSLGCFATVVIVELWGFIERRWKK